MSVGGMADDTSTFQKFLCELDPAVTDLYARHSFLLDILQRESAEAKARDDAYLATLTPAELRRVLLDRRIKALKARYRNWWDEHMAWRFQARRPDREDW